MAKNNEEVVKGLVIGGITGAIAGGFSGFIGAFYEIPIVFIIMLSMIVAMTVMGILYLIWN